jgi:hypothetical protein
MAPIARQESATGSLESLQKPSTPGRPLLGNGGAEYVRRSTDSDRPLAREGLRTVANDAWNVFQTSDLTITYRVYVRRPVR